MKLADKAKPELNGNNEAALTKVQGLKLGDLPYYNLLTLIAQMFDAISKGENLYMIIGATSRRDAYVLTVKQDNSPTSVYGDDLTHLSTQSGDLL